MKLEISNHYYEMAIKWQTSIVRLLQNELEKRGVDPDTARTICRDFMVNLSLLHDEGYIKHDSQNFTPRVCFHDLEDRLCTIDEETQLRELADEAVSKGLAD